MTLLDRFPSSSLEQKSSLSALDSFLTKVKPLSPEELEQLRETLLTTYYAQEEERATLEALAQNILERPQLSIDQQEKLQATIYLDHAATCPPLVKKDLLTMLGSPGRSSGTEELDLALEEAKIQAYSFLANIPPEQAQAQKEQFAFTSGCTDSLNLLASTLEDFWRQALQRRQWQEDQDEAYYLVLAINNHHANLAPWLELSRRLPALKVVIIPYLEAREEAQNPPAPRALLRTCYPLDQATELLSSLLARSSDYLSQDYLTVSDANRQQAAHLDYPSLEQFLALKGDRVLLLSLSSLANANGLANNLKLITELKERYCPQAFTLFDNAQGSLFVQQALADCQQKEGSQGLRQWSGDFIVGSFHKMHGPTGLGYLIMGDKLWQQQQALAQKSKVKTPFSSSSPSSLTREQEDPEAAARARLATLFAKPLTSSSLTTLDANQVEANVSRETELRSSSPHNLSVHLNSDLHFSPLRPQRVGGGLIQHLEIVPGINSPSDYQLHFLSTNPFSKGGTENFLAIVESKEIFTTLAREQLAKVYPLLSLLREYFLVQLQLHLPQVLDLRQAFAEEIKQILAEEGEESPYSLAILPSAGTHISLVLPEDGASDLAIYLQQHNVVVRTGKHCAYPHHHALGLDNTLRLSIGLLNNIQQLDQVVLLIKNFIAENY